MLNDYLRLHRATEYLLSDIQAARHLTTATLTLAMTTLTTISQAGCDLRHAQRSTGCKLHRV